MIRIDDFEAEDEWDTSISSHLHSDDEELNALRKLPLNEKALAQVIIREALSDHVEHIRRQRGDGVFRYDDNFYLYEETAQMFFLDKRESFAYMRHFWCALAGWEEERVVNWFWQIDKRARESNKTFKKMMIGHAPPEYIKVSDDDIADWLETILETPQLARDIMAEIRVMKWRKESVYRVKKKMGIKSAARKGVYPKGEIEWRLPDNMKGGR